MGNEPPVWEVTPETTQDVLVFKLLKALNWYNYFWSNEDYKDSVIEYFSSSKTLTTDQLLSLKSIDKNHDILRGIGGICRVKVRGCKISNKDDEYFNNHVLKLKNILDTKKPKKTTETTVAVVQENIKNKISDSICKVEQKMDEFTSCSNYKSFLKTFNTEKWLSENFKNYECAAICEYLKEQIQEKEEALLGEDPQLVEGYAFLGKVKLKKYVEFLASMIDISERLGNQKQQRKPRKRKIIPPEKLIKNLKYQKEDRGLKLTSFNPRDIIGATKLVLYNTRYCKICIYESDTISGFTIKGTSLKNVTKGSCKVLRKPEKFFNTVSNSFKNISNNFSSLKTKENEAAPRINENTILFKSFK